MFCDLVDSTGLAARIDAEDLRDVIGAYQRRVTRVVQRFGGFVAKYMGDGVLAYFGYPEAHEHDAERAVRAALKITEKVAQLPTPWGSTLQVRVGIATGFVVVGDLIGSGEAQERVVVGETPNLAARLQSMAEAGSVVVAQSTRELIGELFDCLDLGELPVRGLQRPVRAWKVSGLGHVASRFEAMRRGMHSPLIGRREELDLLLRRWERARNGEGRVVLLSGEAGIGKSRLTEAVLEHVEADSPARLRYFCSPYHQDSALYPTIEQLERAMALPRNASSAAKRARLAELIADTSERRQDLSLFAELLSISDDELPPLPATPQKKKELMLRALIRQLEALARRPVLMIYEDAHWLDATSRELLDLVIERIRALPVLLIVTFRPEFQAPWVGQSHVTVLALNRLDRRDGIDLVQRIGPATGWPEDLMAEVVERADGVPLFLEELAKAVLETGGEALTRVPGASVSVPATLHASLLARLDRLGPRAKHIAQAGGAIGREFSHALISAAVGNIREPDLQAGLDALIGADLLFCRGTPPDASYIFKHALVQEAAYGTLLRAPRQTLRARIADLLLERSAAGAMGDPPEIVARHLQGADRIDEAIEWWRRAGEQAAMRAANREAIEHFRRALALIATKPEGESRWRLELAVRVRLGPALMNVFGWSAAEVGDTVERASAVAGLLASSAELAPAVAGLWIFHIARGDYERAERISADLFRIAHDLGDPGILLQAHHASWPSKWGRGHYQEARMHVETARSLFDERRHASHRFIYMAHDPIVCGLGAAACASWALGLDAEALEMERELVERAQGLGHPPTLAHALSFQCGLRAAMGDADRVLAAATELLAFGEENRAHQQRAAALNYLGWAKARKGEVQEGVARARQGLAAWEEMGARLWLPRMLCLAAEASALAGDASTALEQIGSGMAHARAMGEMWYMPRLLHRRGEFLAQLGAIEDAEASMREAIQVARAQRASGWERPAAASLEQLSSQQRRAN